MIVTDSDKTKEFMNSYPEWLQNGFKHPHYRDCKDTLIEGMSKHHVDAIAIDLPQGAVRNEVVDYLNETYPMLPVFHVKESVELQSAVLTTLRRCLDKINEDISDDELSYQQRFNAVRNRWLSKYMRGKLNDYDEFMEKSSIYRAKFCITSPCILANLRLESDEYFQSRWRYGADRLEIALRNFMSHDENAVNIIIAIENNNVCRILFSNVNCKINRMGNMEKVRLFLENSMNEIKEYLGLNIDIIDLKYFENHKEHFNSIMNL